MPLNETIPFAATPATLPPVTSASRTSARAVAPRNNADANTASSRFFFMELSRCRWNTGSEKESQHQRAVGRNGVAGDRARKAGNARGRRIPGDKAHLEFAAE